MVDVTQSMACIQCGACVSDCLSMEIDPLFIGPAALAKAYRFVGDPRDSRHAERLSNLAEDPHGLYACTHCFKCIDACPKGVAPMSQIMRLRRIASQDFHINDRNNGERHEMAIVNSVKKYGTLNEAKMVPDSYGGPLAPAAAKELAASLPVITRALLRRKVTPKTALFHHKNPDQAQIKRIYGEIAGRDERLELNLYITQPDEDPAEIAAHDAHVAEAAAADKRRTTPGQSPPATPTNEAGA